MCEFENSDMLVGMMKVNIDITDVGLALVEFSDLFNYVNYTDARMFRQIMDPYSLNITVFMSSISDEFSGISYMLGVVSIERITLRLLTYD